MRSGNEQITHTTDQAPTPAEEPEHLQAESQKDEHNPEPIQSEEVRRRTPIPQWLFIRSLGVFALAVFLLLGFFQIYWFNGNAIIANLTNALSKVDTALADDDPAEGNKVASDQLITDLSLLVSYQDDLRDWFATAQWLIKLVVPASEFEQMVPPEGAPKGTPSDYEERPSYTRAQRILCVNLYPKDHNCQPPTLPEVRQLRIQQSTYAAEDLVTANLVQQMLQLFGLPFLYGLLGALIFTIRMQTSWGTRSTPQPSVDDKNETVIPDDMTASDASIGRKIKQEHEGSGKAVAHTPTVQGKGRPLEREHPHHLLRILMGALSGVAIAWVFDPSTSGELTKSLQPFALAFIAGYGTDVLFSILDRVVAALSRR